MIGGTRVVARDPAGSAEEKLWYDFSAPANQEYATSVHPCNVSAKITSRNYAYSGPLGNFGALRIEYPATTCNLQGLDEEIFLPGIGLGRRVDLSPGNRTFDLVFARVAAGRKNLMGGFPMDIRFDSIADWHNPAIDQRTLTDEVSHAVRVLNDAK